MHAAMPLSPFTASFTLAQPTVRKPGAWRQAGPTAAQIWFGESLRLEAIRGSSRSLLKLLAQLFADEGSSIPPMLLG
jgi:hypothetical protein